MSPFVFHGRRRSAAAASPVSGMEIWMKSDVDVYQDTSFVVAAGNGDPVGGWKDQSGNNHHATQLLTKRPTITTGAQNGLPTIKGDGVDDFLDLTGYTHAASNWTLFTAINVQTPASAKYFFDTQTGRLVLAPCASPDDKLGWFDGGWNTTSILSAGFQILAWRLNSTGTAGQVFLNGSQVGSNAAYTSTGVGDAVTILSAYDGTSCTTHAIGEWLLYASALSDADMTTTWSYLNGRWAAF